MVSAFHCPLRKDLSSSCPSYSVPQPHDWFDWLLSSQCDQLFDSSFHRNCLLPIQSSPFDWIAQPEVAGWQYVHVNLKWFVADLATAVNCMDAAWVPLIPGKASCCPTPNCEFMSIGVRWMGIYFPFGGKKVHPSLHPSNLQHFLVQMQTAKMLTDELEYTISPWPLLCRVPPMCYWLFA